MKLSPLLLLASLATACYAPEPQPGSSCATGPCPTGLVCSPATQTCERMATDAAPDSLRDPDAPIADASLDAILPPDAMPDAAPGVFLVQEVTAFDNSNTTILSVTLDDPPRPGNVLVMIGGMPAGSLQSVRGGGAVWTLATRSTVHSNIEIWYGVTDGTSSVVTIERTASTSPPRMWVGEWAGLITPVESEGAVALDGVTSPASAGTVVGGGGNGDLVIFAVADGIPNTFGTPGPGMWTPLASIVSASTSQSQWYRFPGSTMNAPSVPETSHQWDAAIVSLRH